MRASMTTDNHWIGSSGTTMCSSRSPAGPPSRTPRCGTRALASSYQKHEGKVQIVHDFPPKDSPVHYASFFQRLYTAYDLRYAYPDSSGRSHRKAWTIKNLTKIGRASCRERV